MNFAKKYVPVDGITDDVFDCKFSEYDCLKVRGIAVGEETDAEDVFLYFPVVDPEQDLSLVDYDHAIAVYRTNEGDYEASVEITDYDHAIAWLARGSEFYDVITSIEQDRDDGSLLPNVLRAKEALCDGEYLSKQSWTQAETEGAYAFFEGLEDRLS